MDWIVIVVVVVAAAAFWALTRRGGIDVDTARACLAAGGRVIDVRSEREWAAGHLPEAVHVPVGELERRIGALAPDKSQPLLLHCASGVRSAGGRRILARMGYTRVYNLGSYRRAERIVRGTG